MFKRSFISSGSLINRIVCLFVAGFFILSSTITPAYAQAMHLPFLPTPGTMVLPTNAYAPALIKGIMINPENALKMNFLVDVGDSGAEGLMLREESSKMVKYFLAALTVPEAEMWVNLSPYEGDRIIPDGLGYTDLGRDLLAQDYLLKQLASSLMYPEGEIGQKFWDNVYSKAQTMFGTTELPVNTFNKVWIVPNKAVIYEKDGGAFLIESSLRVMLEGDYLALQKNLNNTRFGTEQLEVNAVEALSDEAEQMIKEVILPEIEKEVNYGKTFANLRQIYNAMVLATWYKERLKDSLLSQVYVDQNKILGVNGDDEEIKNKIYAQYLEAFQTGVYEYIREDYEQNERKELPRKYFSGGFIFEKNKENFQVQQATTERQIQGIRKVFNGERILPSGRVDEAMNNKVVNVEIALFEQGPLVDAAMVGKIQEQNTFTSIDVSGSREAKAIVDRAMLTDIGRHGLDSWKYDVANIEVNDQTKEVIIKGATWIAPTQTEDIDTEEFLINKENTPRDISLPVRILDQNEQSKLNNVSSFSEQPIKIQVIKKEAESVVNRIYGFLAGDTYYVREDVIANSTPYQLEQIVKQAYQEINPTIIQTENLKPDAVAIERILTQVITQDKIEKQKFVNEGQLLEGTYKTIAHEFGNVFSRGYQTALILASEKDSSESEELEMLADQLLKTREALLTSFAVMNQGQKDNNSNSFHYTNAKKFNELKDQMISDFQKSITIIEKMSFEDADLEIFKNISLVAFNDSREYLERALNLEEFKFSDGVSISNVIKNAVDGVRASPLLDIKSLMDREDVTVKINIDDSVPGVITADRLRLQYPLLNILKNASEAMPNGGTISIDANMVGDIVRIQISDTGKGMMPEVRQNVFNKGFSTKGEAGMGIGMYDVRKMIEAHGGTISVQSQPNTDNTKVATIFTVDIPVQQPIDRAMLNSQEQAEVVAFSPIETRGIVDQAMLSKAGGKFFGYWDYDANNVQMNPAKTELILREAYRISRKNTTEISNEEFLIDDRNESRNIPLQIRPLDSSEQKKIDAIQQSLGLSLDVRVLGKNSSTIINRIYGIPHDGVFYLREDIIRSASAQELGDVLKWAAKDIRSDQIKTDQVVKEEHLNLTSFLNRFVEQDKLIKKQRVTEGRVFDESFRWIQDRFGNFLNSGLGMSQLLDPADADENISPQIFNEFNQVIERIQQNNDDMVGLYNAIIDDRSKREKIGEIPIYYQHGERFEQIQQDFSKNSSEAVQLLESMSFKDVNVEEFRLAALEKFRTARTYLNRVVNFNTFEFENNVDLRNLIKESFDFTPVKVGDVFQPLKSRQDIDIQVNIDENVPTMVTVDRLKMTEFFIDVLQKINRDLPSGSKIIVNAVMADSETVRIQISDTGNGIAKNIQREMFLAPRLVTGRLGKWQGMNQTADLIKVHGGTVSVQSQSNTNRNQIATIFTVDMPIRQQKDPVVVFEKSQERQMITGRTIFHASSTLFDLGTSLSQFIQMNYLLEVVVPEDKQEEVGVFLGEVNQLSQNFQALQENARQGQFDMNDFKIFNQKWNNILINSQQFKNFLPEDFKPILTLSSEEVDRILNDRIAFSEGFKGYNRDNYSVKTFFETQIARISKKLSYGMGEVDKQYVFLEMKNVSDNILVNMNQDWVGSVIENLIKNAHKEIQKESGEDKFNQAGRIRVSISYEQGDLVVKVKDNAGGIPEQFLGEGRFGRKRIFDSDATQGGTGVGTSEAYYVADLYDWDIDVNNKGLDRDRGAEFQIKIPARDLSFSDQAMLANREERASIALESIKNIANDAFNLKQDALVVSNSLLPLTSTVAISLQTRVSNFVEASEALKTSTQPINSQIQEFVALKNEWENLNQEIVPLLKNMDQSVQNQVFVASNAVMDKLNNRFALIEGNVDYGRELVNLAEYSQINNGVDFDVSRLPAGTVVNVNRRNLSGMFQNFAGTTLDKINISAEINSSMNELVFRVKNNVGDFSQETLNAVSVIAQYYDWKVASNPLGQGTEISVFIPQSGFRTGAQNERMKELSIYIIKNIEENRYAMTEDRPLNQEQQYWFVQGKQEVDSFLIQSGMLDQMSTQPMNIYYSGENDYIAKGTLMTTEQVKGLLSSDQKREVAVHLMTDPVGIINVVVYSKPVVIDALKQPVERQSRQRAGRDKAMLSDKSLTSIKKDFTKGGIDLNPEMLDLQIRRDDQGFPLPIDQQSFVDMEIEGFLPVITNISPASMVTFIGN